jgi:hypothetical protein
VPRCSLCIESPDPPVTAFEQRSDQFAHDYPDEPEIQASLLNKGFELAEDLLVSLADVEAFAERYIVER